MPKEEPAMPAADFRAWMEREGLSLRGAQAALGIGSRNSLLKYQEEGAPLTVALACSAITAGLGPWRPQQQETKIIKFDEITRSAHRSGAELFYTLNERGKPSTVVARFHDGETASWAAEDFLTDQGPGTDTFRTIVKKKFGGSLD